MKVGIVGSRSLTVDNLENYIPSETTEIISGGAQGVDQSARKFALQNHIKLTEFLPEYDKYGRSAPLKRNQLIVKNSDLILAFWDGSSRGTRYTITYALSLGVRVKLYCKKSFF